MTLQYVKNHYAVPSRLAAGLVVKRRRDGVRGVVVGGSNLVHVVWDDEPLEVSLYHPGDIADGTAAGESFTGDKREVIATHEFASLPSFELAAEELGWGKCPVCGESFQREAGGRLRDSVELYEAWVNADYGREFDVNVSTQHGCGAKVRVRVLGTVAGSPEVGPSFAISSVPVVVREQEACYDCDDHGVVRAVGAGGCKHGVAE